MVKKASKHKNQVDNIFIDLPDFLRYLFLVYVILQYIVSPIYRVFANEVELPYTYSRLMLSVIYGFLLYLPFIFYKKKDFGILHPLIFISFFEFSKSLLKHTSEIFPRLFYSGPLYGDIHNSGLTGYNQFELAEIDLEKQLCFIFYLLFLYLGYYYFNPKVGFRIYDKNIDAQKPKRILLYVIIIVFISSFIFFHLRGGISSHFSSFGQGRQRALHGMGIIFVFFSFSNLALMIWAAIKKEVFQSFWFWFLVVISMTINYLSYGARSMIFEAVINLLLVWLIHNKKIPYMTIAMLAIFGFFALTLLGALRSTTYKGDVDWSVLTQVDIEENKSNLEEEIKRRDVLNAPDVVILARGVEDFGLFYGKTYLSAILFFVPRFIWDDKPHTISYYTGTMLFNSVGGMPPSTQMEAYWNFHYFGLVLIGFIHGLMYKWMVNFYKANHLQKTSIVLFIIALTKLEPNSLTLTHFVQRFFAVLIIYYIANLVSFKQSKTRKKLKIEN